MISRVMLGPLGRTQQDWRGDQHGNTRNGQFEIHGLDPDAEVPVYFLEPNRKLGATAYFSGKSASGGPVTVRLEPCVTAKARLVDPDGKPVGGFSKPWLISMVVTPGPFASNKTRKEGLLLADEARLTAVDPINYEHNPVSDAQGRITFPALIPGATYRIIDRTPFRGPDGPQHRKDFTVKSGRDPRPGRYLDREARSMTDSLAQKQTDKRDCRFRRRTDTPDDQQILGMSPSRRSESGLRPRCGRNLRPGCGSGTG